jgi:aldose sugar dehydrogenase
MHFISSLLTLIAGLMSLYCNEIDSVPAAIAQDGIRIVKEGLNNPWEITFAKDGSIWMTERDGKLSRVDPATGNTSFSFVIEEVQSRGEGGLLGMALHPGFLKNGWIYLVYDYKGSNGYSEKLVRYTYKQNSLSEPKVLLDNIEAAGIHNGSRLWITNEASPKIFMSTGDASHQALPQKTNTVNGKILRINIDGSIPSDNPFPGNPVWSFGHRNPQGLVMANGKLYSSEHGPTEEDEVNIIEKGRNYGWPEVEGPCNDNEIEFCKSNNVKEPIWSSGDHTLAVCGLDYYNQNLIPQWKNSLLMLTLKDATVWQLKLDNTGTKIIQTQPWFENKWGRLRDLCISPDGKVYICTSNGRDDKLIEITKL